MNPQELGGEMKVMILYREVQISKSLVVFAKLLCMVSTTTVRWRVNSGVQPS
jgi:hypothetical protein